MTTCPITSLLAQARGLAAAGDQAGAAKLRAQAVETSMADVQSPEDLAREEAIFRGAYRRMK